jgi:hypothetical protein
MSRNWHSDLSMMMKMMANRSRLAAGLPLEMLETDRLNWRCCSCCTGNFGRKDFAGNYKSADSDRTLNKCRHSGTDLLDSMASPADTVAVRKVRAFDIDNSYRSHCKDNSIDMSSFRT